MATKSKTPHKKEIKVREYMNNIFETVKQRNPHEDEYHQAVKTLLDSLIPVLVKHPTYMEHGIIDRIVEPERTISFQVPWVNDEGMVQVNRGYRVQFNGTIGLYKGCIHFHAYDSSCLMKFNVLQHTCTSTLSSH